MTKLNQLIAVSNTKKSQSQSVLSQAYKIIQKPDLFDGLEKRYETKNEDDEVLPPESKKVIHRATEIFKDIQQTWIDMFDVVLSQDIGNTEAKANVIVNGKTILENVPAVTLIFLEKQLGDLSTFVSKLPVINPGETWTFDTDQDLYVTDEITTHRTKKVSKPIILHAPTVEHPAQCELVTEDITVGYWKQKKLSGALSHTERTNLQKRINDLREAVVMAREEANSSTVENLKAGKQVMEYIFSD